MNEVFEPYDATKINANRMELFFKTALHNSNLNKELKRSLELTDASLEKQVDVISDLMLAFMQESFEDGEIQSQVWAAEQEQALREFLYGEDLGEILESHDEFLHKKKTNDAPYHRVTKVAKFAAYAFNQAQGYENPIAASKPRHNHYTKPTTEAGRKRIDSLPREISEAEKKKINAELAFYREHPNVRGTIIDLLEEGKFDKLHAEPSQTAMRLIILTESLDRDEKVRNLDPDKMVDLRVELRALVGNETDRRKIAPSAVSREAKSLDALNTLTKRYNVTPIRTRYGTVDDIVTEMQLDTKFSGTNGALSKAVAQAYLANGLEMIFRSEKSE